MKTWTVGFVAAVALLSVGAAKAAPELVVNGGFETSTISTPTQIARPGVSGTTLTGWTNAGYNFLFTPGSADTTGSYSTEYSNYLKLWGPNSGSANGMPATSPVGGNYVGADGNYQTGSISQTIGGLTIGQMYQLSFYWAAGQQAGYDGITTENWGVSFGGQNYRTATVTTANHGFTPWRQEVVYFTATATSQLLSFLAQGTPAGVPPFSLLDGVSLTAAPEPATWLLMMVGLGGVMFVARRRRNGTRMDAAAV